MTEIANIELGLRMHGWARDMFPICRSISGPGVRQTLAYLAELLPGLTVQSVPSGQQVFDWTVPDEWSIRDAYVANEEGRRVIDFQASNLHVVGYSEPVDRWLELKELDQHLYSLPEQPEAIPYITSYYARRWGFCLSHRQRQALRPARYHAVIDSELKPGVLNYGELLLPGESEEEVLLSTYVCHPSLANNELSGPVVTTALAQWLMALPRRRYTYRCVFIAETIGSLIYLSRNLEHLKKHLVAGYVLTCIGDEGCSSFLPSRAGNTLADKAALHALRHLNPAFKRYTWLDRGSDERQYCAPGVDLPVASIMHSKYGTYPEYHTSLDDLNFITPKGLLHAFNEVCRTLEVLETNARYQITVLGEPQLGKRGLYPTLSTKESGATVRTLMNLISYCDGTRSLLDIAELLDQPMWQLVNMLKPLQNYGLVRRVGS